MSEGNINMQDYILWHCLNFKNKKRYYFLENKKNSSIFEVNENSQNAYTHIGSCVRSFQVYCISNKKDIILKDETKREEIFDDETRDTVIWCVENNTYRDIKYFIEYENKLQEITKEQEKNSHVGTQYIINIHNFDELYCYSLLKNKPIITIDRTEGETII